jgi:hypothetical protein
MSNDSAGDFWTFAVIFGLIPIATMITAVVMQRFKTQERLRAIEKGLPLPPEPPPRRFGALERRVLTPREVVANFRVAGIICVAVGLGLLVLFIALAETLPQFPKGVIAVSAVPFFVGVGCLIEYRIRRAEIAAGSQSQ